MLFEYTQIKVLNTFTYVQFENTFYTIGNYNSKEARRDGAPTELVQDESKNLEKQPQQRSPTEDSLINEIKQEF